MKKTFQSHVKDTLDLENNVLSNDNFFQIPCPLSSKDWGILDGENCTLLKRVYYFLYTRFIIQFF